MNDQGLKSMLGFILRNKDEFSEMLECFQAEDIERGVLAIPQKLINLHLRNMILEHAGEYVTDYSVSFQNGGILVTLDLMTKQLGPLYAKLLFEIEGLHFDSAGRKLFLSYKEDVKCGGNMLQVMAFKAAAARGPYLQTLAQMTKLPFISVSGYNAAIDVNRTKFAGKIPPSLTLNYHGCEDGVLKLTFHI